MARKPKRPSPQPAPQPAPAIDEITLTPDQDAALDAAWATITDADIEASMRVFDDEGEEPQTPTL